MTISDFIELGAHCQRVFNMEPGFEVLHTTYRRDVVQVVPKVVSEEEMIEGTVSPENVRMQYAAKDGKDIALIGYARKSNRLLINLL